MFGSSINNKGKKEKNKKILEGPCIFPFQYKWKKHDTCYDTDKGPICATSVSKYGTLKKYGYCVESKSKTRKLKTETFKKKIVKESRKIKKPIKIGMMKLTKKSSPKESPKKSPKKSPKESPKKSPKKRYNEMLIQLMGSLHKLMISKGEPFRARAYQKAEETLMNIDTDITSIAQLKGQTRDW